MSAAPLLLEANSSRRIPILLYASMACGALASVVCAPALILARMQDLQAGPALLLIAGAFPGLAGLATAWFAPDWRHPRRVAIGAILLLRLVVMMALVLAPRVGGGVWVVLVSSAIAQVLGLLAAAAALAWFARLLDLRTRTTLGNRRNALGSVLGFVSLSGAGLLIASGEPGWLLLVALASCFALADLLLLLALPEGDAAPAVIRHCAAQSPRDYDRLWWRLHAGGALASAAVLPLLALHGATASGMTLVAAAATGGTALGLALAGPVVPDAGAIAAASRWRTATLGGLIAILVLAPWAGVPLPWLLALAPLAAGLDGMAAGRNAALDLAATYHLAQDDSAALARIAALGRRNGGLIAGGVVAAAIGGTTVPALAPIILVTVGFLLVLLGWRSLVRHPLDLSV